MRRAKILCAMALTFVVGCSTRQAPIWIGVITFANSDGDDLRGARIAVDDANRTGGIGGRPIQIAVENDSGLGETAVRAAQHLVANPRVIGVVGHMSSNAMLAATSVYDGNLAAVATMATSSELTGISPWVFRMVPSDSALGAREARLFIANGWRRLAVLYENDAYGRGIAATLMSEFRKQGGVLVQQDPVTDGMLDFDIQARRLKQLDPDVIVVYCGAQSGTAFLSAAAKHHLAAPIVGADDWPSSLAQTPAADGVRWPSMFPPSDTSAVATKFRMAFATRYGREPDAVAALSYDAALTILDAIRNGGATRAGVRSALAQPRTLVTGATGAIRFERGDRVGSTGALVRVSGGRLVIDAVWSDADQHVARNGK